MATTNQTIESLIKVTLDEAMKEVDDDSRAQMDPLLTASMTKHFGPIVAKIVTLEAHTGATQASATTQVTTLVPGPKWNGANYFANELRRTVGAEEYKKRGGLILYGQPEWQKLKPEQKEHYNALAKEVREGRRSQDGQPIVVSNAVVVSAPVQAQGTVTITKGTGKPNQWHQFQTAYSSYCRKNNIVHADLPSRSLEGSKMYNAMTEEVFAQFLIDNPPMPKVKGAKKSPKSESATTSAPAPLV